MLCALDLVLFVHLDPKAKHHWTPALVLTKPNTAEQNFSCSGSLRIRLSFLSCQFSVLSLQSRGLGKVFEPVLEPGFHLLLLVDLRLL